MEIDWDNDDLFFTYTWEDETSMWDPEARWCGGSDCYERTYACRVPLAFAECERLIDWWIDQMVYEDEEGFWRDPPRRRRTPLSKGNNE